MISFKQLIEKYAGFVSNNPYWVILLVIIISIIAAIQAQNIEMESMDYSDMLPDNLEVMQTLEIINDEFGGTNSVMIVVESDPQYSNSDEPRDIRDPEIIQYVYLLSEMAQYTDDVTYVTSASSILKNLNNDTLPKSASQIIELVNDNPSLGSYISSNYEMTLVKITLSDDFDEDQILIDLNDVIDQVPKPSSIKSSVAGQELGMAVVKNQLADDMRTTSRASLIGILVILFLVFRSVRYGLTPLATIGVGILWAFGYIGLIGMGMNSATSGVISMIMGIGIDFGIQIVTRFRHELKKVRPERAMSITLNSVFMPMLTTTLAALIGFKAMSLGELTMMGELGTIMSYGIAASFLAAITIIPAILVVGERLSNKKLREEDEQKFMQEERMFAKMLRSKKKTIKNGKVTR